MPSLLSSTLLLGFLPLAAAARSSLRVAAKAEFKDEFEFEFEDEFENEFESEDNHYHPGSVVTPCGACNWFERSVLCHSINDRIEWTTDLRHRDVTRCPARCQTCKNYDTFVASDADASAVFGRGYYAHEPDGSLYYHDGDGENELHLQIRYDEAGNLYDGDWNELHDEFGDWLYDESLASSPTPWEMQHFYEYAHCARDFKTTPNIWETGDSNRMYERILREFSEHSPTVLSRPADSNHARSGGEDPDVGVGPWLIQLEDLLTDDECDEMIAQAEIAIEDDSEDSYSELADDREADSMGGVCQSTQAWCDPEHCMQRPVLWDSWSRIENLVGLPFATHTEPVHFIKYVPGQKYGSHTDSIAEEYNSMAGPRLFTLLLYLNDVEEGTGGQTCFPQIQRAYPDATSHPDEPICIQPKKGRAVIWPNILNEIPGGTIELPENRTWHEAHAITSGLKYASTVWYHLRNFSYAEDIGCTDVYTERMDEFYDESYDEYGEYDGDGEGREEFFGYDGEEEDGEYNVEEYQDEEEYNSEEEYQDEEEYNSEEEYHNDEEYYNDDEYDDDDNYSVDNEYDRYRYYSSNKFYRKYAGDGYYAGDSIETHDDDGLPMA